MLVFLLTSPGAVQKATRQIGELTRKIPCWAYDIPFAQRVVYDQLCATRVRSILLVEAVLTIAFHVGSWDESGQIRNVKLRQVDDYEVLITGNIWPNQRAPRFTSQPAPHHHYPDRSVGRPTPYREKITSGEGKLGRGLTALLVAFACGMLVPLLGPPKGARQPAHAYFTCMHIIVLGFVGETAAGRSVLRATWWVAGMLSSTSVLSAGWLRLCTFWTTVGFWPFLMTSPSKEGAFTYYTTASKSSTAAQFSQLQMHHGVRSTVHLSSAPPRQQSLLSRPLPPFTWWISSCPGAAAGVCEQQRCTCTLYSTAVRGFLDLSSQKTGLQ